MLCLFENMVLYTDNFASLHGVFVCYIFIDNVSIFEVRSCEYKNTYAKNAQIKWQFLSVRNICTIKNYIAKPLPNEV